MEKPVIARSAFSSNQLLFRVSEAYTGKNGLVSMGLTRLSTSSCLIRFWNDNLHCTECGRLRALGDEAVSAKEKVSFDGVFPCPHHQLSAPFRITGMVCLRAVFKGHKWVMIA